MASIRILKAMLKDWRARVAAADDSIKRAKALKRVRALKKALQDRRKRKVT